MMSAMTKPQPWNVAAGTTMAPWLWRDLAYLFPLWWGPDGKADGSIFDVVGREWFAPLTSSSGSIETQATPYGYGLHLNNGSNAGYGKYYELPSGRIGNNGADPYTLFAVCAVKELPSSRSGAQDEVLFGYTTGSGGNNYPIYFNNNDKIQLWDASSAFGDTAITPGQYYTLVMTGEDYKDGWLYVDGKEAGGPASMDAWGSGEPLNVFYFNDRSLDGYCPIFGAWNRHLSIDEIRLLAMDPFIMLRPMEF
jgi:hypothetical protein